MEKELSFAEAMALDPSDVEFSYTGATWSPLADTYGQSFGSVRSAHFRLRRPRRSRAQDMAEAYFGGPFKRDIYAEGCGDAIRAVCEYLRTQDDHPAVAARIEREFLEKLR